MTTRKARERVLYALPYMPQLNSVRALAVTGVLVNHFIPQTGQVLDLGLMGVFLFFVLSGFLITAVLLRAREAVEGGLSVWSAIGRFYARRCLRIFPLYYLTLLIMWLANLAPVRETLPWHVSYLSNVLIYGSHAWIGRLSHLWSLDVEEQFYAVWPLLIILTPRRHLIAVASVATLSAPVFKIVGTLTFATPAFIRVLPVSCFDMLGAGALLAIVTNARSSRLTAHTLRTVGLVAGIPVLLAALVLRHFAANVLLVHTIEDCAVSLLSVWLVAGASAGFTGRAGRFFEQGWLMYIGIISYGIYIIHFLVPEVFKWLRSLGLPAFPRPVDVVLFIATTILLAALSWTLYERPIGRLKRHVPYAPYPK